MKNDSNPARRTGGLFVLCLALFVLPQARGQDVEESESALVSGVAVKVLVYGKDSFWVLPTKRSDRVEPRFLDAEGLFKELEQIQKRGGEAIRVLVSAAESMPAKNLAAAMAACSKAGVGDISLSVYTEEEGEVAPAEVAVEIGVTTAVEEAGEVADGGVEEAEVSETRLSSRVEGFVMRVLVRAGDKVKAGQVLLEIDRSEQELLMRMAEAKIRVVKSDIEISEATCDLARGALDGLEKAAQGSITPLEKQRAAFHLKTAEAELRGKLAMLEIAEAEAQLMALSLERCQVKSPVDGMVTEVAAHVGEAVGKGQILLEMVPGGD